MAIVTMPLMSESASGTYGKILTFASRLGRNVVRKRVIPRNPQTQNQQDVRNAMRVAAKIIFWVSHTTEKAPVQTKTDKERLIAVVPSNTLWNTLLSASIIGQQEMNYLAAVAAYGVLTELQKGAWDTAAGALTPKIPTVVQVDAGGIAGDPIAPGQVFFTFIYALSLLGLATTPGGTPPAYT